MDPPRIDLYERRRQAKRQRRRIMWAGVHMAIFAGTATFMFSRAAQMQNFVDQLRGLVQQQPETAERPAEPVQMGPPVVRRREQPGARVDPQRRMPATPARPASSSRNAAEANTIEWDRPSERSLADLLEPADNPEEEPQTAEKPAEPQEWELVFDFDSGVSSVEIPDDVDVSLLELVPAEGVNVAEETKDVPLSSGKLIRRLRDAEAVQFLFDVDSVGSPERYTRITMRVMARNLAGRPVRFRRRDAETAMTAQKKIILRTSNQLSVATTRRQQISNWLSSSGTKTLDARNAAKNQVAALDRTIATLKKAIPVQQKVLQAYLATFKLGESLDDSAVFVVQVSVPPEAATSRRR